ncbi:MAG: phenylalanine--tRNA ligase subunit beta [Chloroflexota bacterium]|nr:phenylalanine--tRNA ligase subunit beta [Chloroflexota bacterium]
MKVPMRWLREFVDTGLPAKELAHRLTMAGLEAEKVETIGDGWQNVFVGHVDTVERHPDADRLVLATVTAGEHHLTVVTGAPNIAAGQVVPLALAGARLIDGHSEGQVYKTLKPGVIRGVRSEGMVCSEKELGLSDEHEGIMVLEAAAPVGAPLADWLGDTVIEFEITPNLVHAFSVHGIAREAAAITAHDVTLPPLYNLAQAPHGASDLVTIEADDLCPRYAAVVFDGVAIGPSPAWLQRRLNAAGVRPINNIVDVTNYVMLEFGQPLHAFDADKLRGDRIVVRRARAGETLETIDHIERPLSPDMLVIADAESAVAVAGVMGGVESETSDASTRILLEAANFDMKSVRRTARALKMRSDASARYERGIDPNQVSDAVARAVQLILELSPGASVTAFSDAYPHPRAPQALSVPFGEIERLLGVRIPPQDVQAVLERLGFSPRVTEDTIDVLVPTWRSDVTMAADIVEEVARIVGYETLPETLPTGETPPVRRDAMFLFQQKARRTLAGLGFWETISYVTVGAGDLLKLSEAGTLTPGVNPIPVETAVRLRNPMQAERDLLRPTLLPSVVETAARNLKHQRSVRLFEIARVYLPSDAGLPSEAATLALVLAGKRDELDRFADATAELDFFDAKGAIETLLERLGVRDATFRAISLPAFHPGRTAGVYLADTLVGVVGELRPDRALAFDIEASRVAIAEIDLEALLTAAKPIPSGITSPRFLPVEQDFAVVVNETVPASDVLAALRSGAGPLASGFELFDVYRGPQLGEGRKSLAYRIAFTAPNRALTDAELGKVREKIGKTLRQMVQGELRA